jgi:hypothetical protein
VMLRSMHAAGNISDCALKKLDAPPLPSPLPAPAPSRDVQPELRPFYAALDEMNVALASITDPHIRAVVVKTLPDILARKLAEVAP